MKKLLLSTALLSLVIPAYSMDDSKNDKKANRLPKTKLVFHEEVEDEGNKKLSSKEEELLAQELQKKSTIAEEKAVMKFPQVHFSPDIEDVLIKCIHDEKESMRGAWYRFTLYNLAKKMVERIEKKVAVSLIIDQGNFGGTDEGDFCEGLKLIAECGGKIYKKVRARNSDSLGNFEIMHHKFMIFNKNVLNKKLLWTGSFNATGQSNRKNCENAVVIDDSEAIEQFEKEYETVEALSDLLNPDQCTSTKTKKKDRKTNFARDMNGIPH